MPAMEASLSAASCFDCATGLVVLLGVDPVLVSAVLTLSCWAKSTPRIFCEKPPCGAVTLAPPVALPPTISIVLVLKLFPQPPKT